MKEWRECVDSIYIPDMDLDHTIEETKLSSKLLQNYHLGSEFKACADSPHYPQP